MLPHVFVSTKETRLIFACDACKFGAKTRDRKDGKISIYTGLLGELYLLRFAIA
jgi:hypothetical protein